jgi:hypothetical protein
VGYEGDRKDEEARLIAYTIIFPTSNAYMYIA